MRRLAYLLFLLASQAMGASDYWTKTAEKPRETEGGLFFEGSLFDLGHERARVSYAINLDPSLETRSDIKGFALGGGWDFGNGISLGLHWMHGHESISARWLEAPAGASPLSVDSGHSRDGYMLTGRMTWQAAKRLARRACCCEGRNP